MQHRRKFLIPAIVLGIVFILPILVHKNGYFLHLITIVTINVILAVSLRLVLLTGHFNLGHAAFAGIGAYTSAILATKLGFPFIVDLLAAGVFASLSTRIRHPKVKRYLFCFSHFYLCFLNETGHYILG